MPKSHEREYTEELQSHYLYAFKEDGELEQKKKTISYTHEEIASLTGLNRVTVTKILNDFYQKGWIDLAYRKIIIVDHDELSNYLDK